MKMSHYYFYMFFPRACHFLVHIASTNSIDKTSIVLDYKRNVLFCVKKSFVYILLETHNSIGCRTTI